MAGQTADEKLNVGALALTLAAGYSQSDVASLTNAFKNDSRSHVDLCGYRG